LSSSRLSGLVIVVYGAQNDGAFIAAAANGIVSSHHVVYGGFLFVFGARIGARETCMVGVLSESVSEAIVKLDTAHSGTCLWGRGGGTLLLSGSIGGVETGMGGCGLARAFLVVGD
jgi:hypothetical protein